VRQTKLLLLLLLLLLSKLFI